jgi:hypothetical protein
MIIQVLFVLFISYLIYRQGLRSLFKSRISENINSDHIAYGCFMLTGLIMGSYLTLYAISEWMSPLSVIPHIAIISCVSILLGEGLYHRNKYLIYKIISPQTKEPNKNS